MGLLSVFQRHQTAKSSTNRVVGIDIGSSSIKVVELQDREGVVTLTTYGQLQLGPYEEGKKIGQIAQLTPTLERQAMIDILRESAVKTKEAVLAIPLMTSFVTVMSIEAKIEDDISSRVRVEARKYIPVPIADVMLDWADIDTGTAAGGMKRDILLAAIQNDALKRFTSLMQMSELGQPPKEIECFSTIRAAHNAGDSFTAIVDIGATTTKLYITHDGLLQRMHRIPSGGTKLTEKIAEELKLTFEQAEDLKCSLRTDHPQYAAVQKIATGQFGRVFKELTQVLREYESLMGIEVSDIALSGGASITPGLLSLLAQETNRHVSLLRPFEKVAYPAFMEDALVELGPLFATALGAALRPFE
jgi:type IV pilus assembly protein PilM